MGNKVVEIKGEQRISRDALSEFLSELAEQIESGHVVIRQGDQEAQADIPDQVELEVELEHRPKKTGEKYSLELEIEWYTGQGSGEIELG